MQSYSTQLQNWYEISTVDDLLNIEYIGDDIHMEFVGIPGGTVKSLHPAFCCEYSNQDIIVDVLLVAGLNDILHHTEPGPWRYN